MDDFQFVVVEWLDHTEPADANWTSSLYPDSRLATCFSAGWILRSDDEELVIVPHICFDGDDLSWSSPLIISSGSVRRKWIIKNLPNPE
jgi:hypothetical protein